MPLHLSFLLVLFLAVVCTPLRAEEPSRPQAPARVVKAAYIYNLINFVEWAEAKDTGTPQDPIIICVVGSDPVGFELDEIRSRLAKGRPIQVQHLSKTDPIPYCHILYIGSSENTRLADILQQTKVSGVLTVSDLPDFTELGGMVGFLTEHERVFIEINVPKTKAAGVKISARLLEIARLYPRKKS